MNAPTTFPIDTPPLDTPEADGRARLIAVLRQRGEGGSEAPGAAAEDTASTAPALAPLIAALPGDDTRAPQTGFTRDLQVLFVENLSVTGSVRSAASAAGVSHQTVYRARRSQPHFRLAWDGALVAARVNAAEILAARAIDGVEEQVFYHGEIVGSRRRFSDRLLLAHLARLDRIAGDDAPATAFAEDWDAAMARFAQGEDPLTRPVAAAPERAGPGRPGSLTPGPCNTRSMSLRETAPAEPRLSDFQGIRADQPERLRTACCDGLRWPECHDCPQFDALGTIRAAMAKERPDNAPPIAVLGDPARVEECQIEVFQTDAEARWWLIGEDYCPWEASSAGGWRRAG